MRPVFPQPAHCFAGRRVEIERILAHVDRDPLFLIYGVGGIGKSELVYQVVSELRARPAWAAIPAVLVDVRAGMTGPRILAQLLAAVGATRAPRRLPEQLSHLARILEARPHVVFIDDVHHLPGDELARALAYLARRLGASRLLVASRREVVLPAEAPPPVVTTLGPLDAAAAEQMTAALAERLEIARPAPDRLMRATHGSPFHIHRMLARHAARSSTIEETLAELSPAARRLLLAASVLQQRTTVEQLRQSWRDGAAFDRAARELAQHFLIATPHDELVVHNLIREVLAEHGSPDELVAAHADAAEQCLRRLDLEPCPPPLLAVDAVQHLLAAGRPDDAWAVIERWYPAIAATGSEHLLRDPLARLRAALPARRVAIDLLVARGLVRGSQLDEARRMLAAIGDVPGDADEARYCALAGELAQGAGELARAEQLLGRALACASDRDTRFGIRLRVATNAMFAGDGARARHELADALAELTAPTRRQRARAAWALTASWMFDERYELAAAEARRARHELAGDGVDDLANQLAMLETLACIEHGDMVSARVAARAIDEAGLRRPVAALYRAIARYADGEAGDAAAALVAAHEQLQRQGDIVNAYLAGYYASAALAELGSLGKAQALAEASGRLAAAAGWRLPAARSLAQQALLAAEGLQSAVAHRLADAALASDHIAPRSAARARCAHAHAATMEGDIALAREQLVLARVALAAEDLAAPHAAIDIEHAAVELVGGDLDRAVELGERVIAHQTGATRGYAAAHARLILAASYVARGRRSDLVLAERTLSEARSLADAGHLRSIQVGCAIVLAALARRDHRERASREVLASALRELDPERGSVYASTLVAAIDGGIAARTVPGALALLAHLGFSDSVDCFLVDRRGRRAALARELAREREVRELFVDEARALIVAGGGSREVAGRPLLCALLSVLVQARGAPVAPETVYKRVWGVAEYHPLQHRNALYVAINRLRACLRELLPEREVVERAGSGWRLASDVDVCVAIAARPATAQKTM